MIMNLTSKLIEKLKIEINKDDNIKLFQVNVVDPVITYMSNKLFPYFIIIFLLFLIITLLSIINFVILFRSKSSPSN